MPWRLSASLVVCARDPLGFKVLFVKRSKDMRFMPNLLVFPGGKLEERDLAGGRLTDSEALKECAGRELLEETGLRVDAQQSQFLCAFITPDVEAQRQKKGGFDTTFFLNCINSVQEVQPDGVEVTTAVWETPEQALKKFDLAPPQK
eukprot:GEMP01105812.1.p1 GENE.GEMP01105812.1~~GEMP01105812.1.p1  ORF type:complete len:154 (+),score=43.50 GEMP01105812.1:23-463(+)